VIREGAHRPSEGTYGNRNSAPGRKGESGIKKKEKDLGERPHGKKSNWVFKKDQKQKDRLFTVRNY